MQVEKVFQPCEHKINVKCAEMSSHELCVLPCQKLAPCGHKCKGLCSEPCAEVQCREIVSIETKKSSCGHSLNVPCFEKDTGNLTDFVDELNKVAFILTNNPYLHSQLALLRQYQTNM